MSTSVFVDPEIFTQADRAQSPRVPIPLLEDPYEAIRQTYFVGKDTEFEPFEGEAKTPESPHTVAPPTCHVGESEGSGTSGTRSTSSNSTMPLSLDHPLTHTTHVLVPSPHRIVCMAVRVPPMMSPSLPVSIAEMAAMPDLAFRKRFRSSYDSSPSPTFPEEDEEVEESSDSDSESEDAEDQGPTAEDKDPAAWDEGLDARDEGPSFRVESLSLGGDETIPKGQQRAAPVVETAVGKPLGLGYGALRLQDIASREGKMPSVFELGQASGSVPESERSERVSALRQPTLTTWLHLEDGIVYIDVPAYPPPGLPVQTPPSPKWSSSSLLISLAPSIVPLPISSPMISLTVPSSVASPATAEAKGFLNEDIGELFTRSGAVRDEIFSQSYQYRSLEHEQEMTAMMFGDLWRPVLELEAWTWRVDTQMATMSQAEYDDHRLV
nr:hypothetical protein [Tanacetum cinerariifolium]